MRKKILIPITDGSEEMEAVIIIDLLRRAEFVVTVVSDKEVITASRGVKIIPDVNYNQLFDYADFDALILPGGTEGVENLKKIDALKQITIRLFNDGKLIGAICAAPTILKAFGILNENNNITSHPGVQEQLKEFNYFNDKVVIDDNIITSRGAGTAIEFALKIIEILDCKEKSQEIAKSIVFEN